MSERNQDIARNDERAKLTAMEAVVLIGIPASGKSTFFATRFAGTHVRINLDMLRTRHRETVSLAIASEWEEKRVAFLREMRAGLCGAGADASLDSVGTAERPLWLLRVRVPARWLEEADVWLMRLVEPWSGTAEWASHVALLLTASRWPEFPVWSGGESACAAITERIPPTDRTARWPGSGFLVIGSHQPTIAAFPRTVMRVLRELPDGKRLGGATDDGGSGQRWVALDLADGADVAALRELQRVLGAAGVATQRRELGGGRCLLAVDVGDDWLDQFEARLVQKLAEARTPWPSRLRLWSWSGAIAVHRHPEPEGWQVREWLEQRLGAPCVSACRRAQRDEVAIQVPPRFVDRALTILRERFA